MATLEIRNVTKSFGAVEVLREVNLAIGDGEFLVLVGPSGCGKSTLLNIVAGLLDLTRGSILIDGAPVEHLEPKERDIAMVFQSYALYPSMTVAGNIGFALKMRGVPAAERDRKVQEVAELLQIAHLLDRKPQALSGGQRQRVAMGRALVRNPKIFLFDEPLSNLDAKLRVDMRHEIKKLHQRLRTTIVYVTHDQVEAMTMASRIAVMKDGVVQQFGTPEEIYERPANTFVATFMGSPAMNLLDGAVAGGAIALDGGARLPLPTSAPALAEGRKVRLGLRPEWFTPLPPDAPAEGALEAEVEVIEPTGPDIYAALRVGGAEVMTRLPAGTSLTPGEVRRFRVDTAKAIVFDAASGAALVG
ncbi:MAG: sn-glycerol-3-phosphate ABC transporter ATP-binding protein UgpC [Rhodobacteraceae bacterium]|jgi:multiple sugar transport system ATP-binding protein|nr:sn-glycerol-3-phosphate ABC transporter ATP-binding protein UgpC [Paracoccaceae bacterium]